MPIKQASDGKTAAAAVKKEKNAKWALTAKTANNKVKIM